MTALRFIVPLILLTAACSPAWPDASTHLRQTAQPDTLVPAPVAVNDQKHTAPPANAPVISVGVSDSSYQLHAPFSVNVLTRSSAVGTILPK